MLWSVHSRVIPMPVRHKRPLHPRTSAHGRESNHQYIAIESTSLPSLFLRPIIISSTSLSHSHTLVSSSTMSQKPKLTLFVDIVSPFAYMAFYVLQRSAAFKQVEITYIPIFLGGVMKACDNRPPISITSISLLPPLPSPSSLCFTQKRKGKTNTRGQNR
jgi:hypothetical protein